MRSISCDACSGEGTYERYFAERGDCVVTCAECEGSGQVAAPTRADLMLRIVSASNAMHRLCDLAHDLGCGAASTDIHEAGLLLMRALGRVGRAPTKLTNQTEASDGSLA